MRVYTQEAVGLGERAKHWGSATSVLGDGLGEPRLQRATSIVREFNGDNEVPRELKLAASTIWVAVQAAPHAELYNILHDRGFLPNLITPSREYSEDRWRMHFIQDRFELCDVPENLGLVFTRSERDPLREQLPSEAYIWVRESQRRRGVATAAIEALRLDEVPNLTAPFEIGLRNQAAAAKLLQRCATKTPIAA